MVEPCNKGPRDGGWESP